MSDAIVVMDYFGYSLTYGQPCKNCIPVGNKYGRNREYLIVEKKGRIGIHKKFSGKVISFSKEMSVHMQLINSQAHYNIKYPIFIYGIHNFVAR